MSSAINDLVPYIRWPSLIMGLLCLGLSVFFLIRSNEDRDKSDILKNHLDKLNDTLKFLSENWKT
jgi:hypothetical protein